MKTRLCGLCGNAPHLTRGEFPSEIERHCGRGPQRPFPLRSLGLPPFNFRSKSKFTEDFCFADIEKGFVAELILALLAQRYFFRKGT